MTYTKTVQLPVDVDEAFALVTQPERLRRWQTVSAQVDRGSRNDAGTSGQLSGTMTPKLGSVRISTASSEPSTAARTIARVWAMFIR